MISGMEEYGDRVSKLLEVVRACLELALNMYFWHNNEKALTSVRSHSLWLPAFVAFEIRIVSPSGLYSIPRQVIREWVGR